MGRAPALDRDKVVQKGRPDRAADRGGRITPPRELSFTGLLQLLGARPRYLQ
jgi:hypothetical protein